MRPQMVTGSSNESSVFCWVRVSFFSTACPYCMASIPEYREAVTTRCDQTFLFVVFDREGPDLEEWWSVNAWGPEEPCATVRVANLGLRMSDLGVMATPTHVVLGEGTRVEEVNVGQIRSGDSWLGGD